MYKRLSQGWAKHLDFILLDIVTLHLALIFSYSMRHGGLTWPYRYEAWASLGVLLTILDFSVAIIFNTMHNVLKRGYFVEFVETLKQAVLVYSLVTVYMFTLQSGSTYSRIAVTLMSVFHVFLGYTVRILWKAHVKKNLSDGSNSSAMILVAEDEAVRGVLSELKNAEDRRVVGIVISNRNAKGETIENVPVVANLADAAEYICREWVDEVFVFSAEPEADSDFIYSEGEVSDEREMSFAIDDFISQCEEMAVPVHIRIPLAQRTGQTFIEKISSYNVVTSTKNYMTTSQTIGKRALDLAGGLVGSFIALIIMAVIGPQIKKASPGPILFTQERIGQNGKKFKLFKIRSMYMDAEQRKAALMKENRNSDGMMFKMDFDPRIIGNEILPDGTKKTGLGEWIRKTSLDEFPQFFNVLLGQMSLVGTRPPTVDEWEKYKYHHRARLSVKPGITGMWQVSGRSNITDFEEVVKLDTQYIQNWSFSMDIKILIKTVGTVLLHKGAM